MLLLTEGASGNTKAKSQRSGTEDGSAAGSHSQESVYPRFFPALTSNSSEYSRSLVQHYSWLCTSLELFIDNKKLVSFRSTINTTYVTEGYGNTK